MAKKKMNFDSMDSLAPISLIIDEADEAVRDKARNITNSPISEILFAVGGAGVGVVVDIAIISLIAGKYIGKLGMPAILHVLKVIGGGNAKNGLVLLAIPVAALTIGVHAIVHHINSSKLRLAKEELLQKAIEKLASVVAAKKEEIDATVLRVEELTRLNILLTEYIKKLKEDLSADRPINGSGVYA